VGCPLLLIAPAFRPGNKIIEYLMGFSPITGAGKFRTYQHEEGSLFCPVSFNNKSGYGSKTRTMAQRSLCSYSPALRAETVGNINIKVK